VSDVTIEHLTKTFRRRRQAIRALDDVTVHASSGELLVLLGPSGSGKTTLMRCLAGLEAGDTGRISLDGRPVWDPESGRDVPPNKRGVGMVFQNYALWPHMTVNANVAYPLRVQHRKSELSEGRVREVLDVVGCGDLGARYPAELSGGQQQRVALARALADRPKVLLFDEPLSNIDTRVRLNLRDEIARLHRTLGFTGIYVTHDQSEALILGTQVAVMHEGRIQQLGTPEQVYRAPTNHSVARFLGVHNVVALTDPILSENLRSIVHLRMGTGTSHEEEVSLCWRPEDTLLCPSSSSLSSVDGGVIGLGSGTIIVQSYGGDWNEYTIEVAGMHIKARRPVSEGRVQVGARIQVYIREPLLYERGELVNIHPGVWV
jgi:iron(III) transport system ATP-binding protein